MLYVRHVGGHRNYSQKNYADLTFLLNSSTSINDLCGKQNFSRLERSTFV